VSLVGAILIVVGAALSALGAVGVLRFPDVYTRLHAASKAGAPGVGLILLGCGVASADPFTIVRGVVGLVFLMLVAPVSAHLLARAAVRNGIKPVPATSIDEVARSRDQ
jgi:multicomponent Na+:H+ antiporter subunit G